MVQHISRDLQAHPTSDCVTVTLGDYIDRGPDSRGVLDRLVHNPFPTELVALKGNHEVLFEMFLNDPAVAEDWRRLGGLETLYSRRPRERADDGRELPTSGGGARSRGAERAFQVFGLPQDIGHQRRVFPLPASRWSDKASKICCGFATSFSKAR